MTAALSKNEQKIADKIAPIREAVQTFMAENIKSYETRLSSPAIYEKMGDAVKDISKQDFQLGLSMSVRGGLISGFRGVRGKNGGYCPEGTGPAPKAKSESKDGTEETNTRRIEFGEGVTLVSHDALNWCLEGIGTKLYWPSLSRALEGASKTLMDRELKALTEGGVNLQDLSGLIEKAQENIVSRIKQVVAD